MSTRTTPRTRPRRPAERAGLLLVVTALATGCGDDEPAPAADRELRLGTETIPERTARERPTPRPAPRPAARERRPPARPAMTARPIPFDATRVQQTAAYSERHYGRRTSRLVPKVIVQHYTVFRSVDQVISLFSRNRPDAELNELPGVCSHFLIDRDGTILQLVPLRLICRHTVGLNHVAIGIEHIGASDSEVLRNEAQMRASLRLTAWLRCRYGIALKDVIGHAESLSSPHHHERVPALRRQSHDDFALAAMRQYRARLGEGDC